MKAFKKWWKEQCLKRIGNKQPMYIAKDAYREALENVLKQVDLLVNEGAGLSYRIIIDWIKKELEEK